jgi:hypothetical protein
MFNTERIRKTQGKRFSGKRVVLFFLLISFFFPLNSQAQCAMCRAALTSEGNKAKAAAVNDGIVYLMVIPYLLVGGIGYAVYRMRKNKK